MNLNPFKDNQEVFDDLPESELKTVDNNYIVQEVQEFQIPKMGRRAFILSSLGLVAAIAIDSNPISAAAANAAAESETNDPFANVDFSHMHESKTVSFAELEPDIQAEVRRITDLFFNNALTDMKNAKEKEIAESQSSAHAIKNLENTNLAKDSDTNAETPLSQVFLPLISSTSFKPFLNSDLQDAMRDAGILDVIVDGLPTITTDDRLIRFESTVAKIFRKYIKEAQIIAKTIHVENDISFADIRLKDLDVTLEGEDQCNAYTTMLEGGINYEVDWRMEFEGKDPEKDNVDPDCVANLVNWTSVDLLPAFESFTGIGFTQHGALDLVGSYLVLVYMAAYAEANPEDTSFIKVTKDHLNDVLANYYANAKYVGERADGTIASPIELHLINKMSDYGSMPSNYYSSLLPFNTYLATEILTIMAEGATYSAKSMAQFIRFSAMFRPSGLVHPEEVKDQDVTLDKLYKRMVKLGYTATTSDESAYAVPDQYDSVLSGSPEYLTSNDMGDVFSVSSVYMRGKKNTKDKYERENYDGLGISLKIIVGGVTYVTRELPGYAMNDSGVVYFVFNNGQPISWFKDKVDSGDWFNRSIADLGDQEFIPQVFFNENGARVQLNTKGLRYKFQK